MEECFIVVVFVVVDLLDVEVFGEDEFVFDVDGNGEVGYLLVVEGVFNLFC